MNISRRRLTAGLTAASTTMLTSCGTILYPERAHQKNRGRLDPAVAILDGIGLILFLIPGLVAFAVDFSTGAIYFPAGHEPGDRETTIFDKVEAGVKPTQGTIEKSVAEHIGHSIDLGRPDVCAFRIERLEEFPVVMNLLGDKTTIAAC